MGQFKLPTQLESVSAGLAKAASDALRNLLENHHLYQSVASDITTFEKTVEKIRAKPTSPFSPMSGEDVATIRRLTDFRNNLWAFTLEGVLPSILIPPLRRELPTVNWFQLPTVRVACSHCDGIKPPHNPGYVGITSDFTYTFTSIPNSNQIFAFPYQCQNCKCEPVFFLVRREGVKLTLVGRSQFPEILIPDFIPKNQRKFYRNAIIADQTSFTLAAALYLRTVIEQHFYQAIPEPDIKAIRGNPTGDELAELYAKTLPKNFPDSFPSLKKAYEDLSKIVHSGKEADETKKSFAMIRAAVDGHFKALQLFKEMPAG